MQELSEIFSSMIVVDNTVLVDFWLGEAELRERSRKLFQQDPDWFAPGLWRFEFGNVVAKYFRLGKIDDVTKLAAYAGCERMVESVHEVKMEGVDGVVCKSGLKFYDATYVWLAGALGAPLFTRDAGILRACPEIARSMP